VPAEPLEQNYEKGVYFMKEPFDNHNQQANMQVDQTNNAANPQQFYELSYALFNPKIRVLVTGGDHFNATMYDLRADDYRKYLNCGINLPHVSG